MPIHRRTFVLSASAASLAACISPSIARADEKPSYFHGEIPDDPAAPGRAPDSLGRAGVLLIRSQPHLDWVLTALQAAGFQMPASKPAIQADFAKQSVAMIYHYGDEGNQFAVHKQETSDKRSQLDIVMSYIIYKKRDRVVNKFQFVAVPIPRRDETAVSISTYHPQNGGAYPTAEKARLEWAHTFTTTDGDNIDGLQATLRPEKREVAQGDDIRLTFELRFDSPMKEGGQFGQASEAAFVWDGKYSNGYRNHAFLVEFPDGKAKIFRLADNRQWDKNSPHPVQVSAGKPYVLPEWVEGTHLKSLKQLGLDTQSPGNYTITGLYTQNAAEPVLTRRGTMMWGGRIASAPVTVVVK